MLASERRFCHRRPHGRLAVLWSALVVVVGYGSMSCEFGDNEIQAFEVILRPSSAGCDGAQSCSGVEMLCDSTMRLQVRDVETDLIVFEQCDDVPKVDYNMCDLAGVDIQIAGLRGVQRARVEIGVWNQTIGKQRVCTEQNDFPPPDDDRQIAGLVSDTDMVDSAALWGQTEFDVGEVREVWVDLDCPDLDQLTEGICEIEPLVTDVEVINLDTGQSMNSIQGLSVEGLEVDPLDGGVGGGPPGLIGDGKSIFVQSEDGFWRGRVTRKAEYADLVCVKVTQGELQSIVTCRRVDPTESPSPMTALYLPPDKIEELLDSEEKIDGIVLGRVVSEDEGAYTPAAGFDVGATIAGGSEDVEIRYISASGALDLTLTETSTSGYFLASGVHLDTFWEAVHGDSRRSRAADVIGLGGAERRVTAVRIVVPPQREPGGSLRRGLLE